MTADHMISKGHLAALANQPFASVEDSLTTGTTATPCNQSDGFPRRAPKLHVLFLIDTFHQKMGGGESTLVKITRLLSGERYRCSVATFASRSDLADIKSEFSCPVYVFALRKTYDWNALKVAIKLRQLIRSQKVTIVHTFFLTSDIWGGWYQSSVAALCSCRAAATWASYDHGGTGLPTAS